MRRTLLAWSSVAAIAALAVAACGGGDDDDDTSATATATRATTSGQQVELVAAGSDFYAGEGNHFVFAILTADGQLVEAEDVAARFFDARDGANPVEMARVPAVRSAPGAYEESEHVHDDGSVHVHGGEDEKRGVYYATVDFPFAGTWGIVAEGTLKDGTPITGQMAFTVLEEPAFPAPGEPAIASDNLTRFDVDDIFTIDSGDVPNDMHDVVIGESIAEGRPLVIAFATPGFCQTQFCGPVVQEVEALHDDYGDRVDFVHIEIWLGNRQGNELNPTVVEWLEQPDGSLTEPWVYVIDKDGVIYDRWEGAVARNIMEPAVEAVANGATYGAE